MAGRARVASHLTSGKGGIPEDAGGYNACSLSRSQLPPVLSVGLRQRSIKAQGKARQSFLYISAELTRLTLGACARSAAIAGRDGMRSSNT
jgi:hypothetical protein